MAVELYRRPRKRRWRLTRRGKGAVVVLLLLVVVGLSRFCAKDAPEGVYPESIGNIPVITDLVDEHFAARTGIKREIRWIVIHETGNTAASATAENHNGFLHNENQKDATTAWHYTVDEKEIYHHLPDDEVAYHAGDGLNEGGGNACGVGIEICVNEGGDFAQATDNAAMLTAYLLEAYDLSWKDVKQHGDFMNKNCPERLRADDDALWNAFIGRVKQYQKQF